MAYSVKRLQERNIIKRAINRYNSVGTKLQESPQFNSYSILFEKLDYAIGTKPNKQTIDAIEKALADSNYKEEYLNRLKEVKTLNQIIQETSRQMTGKGVIPSDKKRVEQIKQELKQRTEDANWIQNHMDEIYEFEKRYGNVVTGHSGQMSYADIRELRKNVETMLELDKTRTTDKQRFNEIERKILDIKSKPKEEQDARELEELEREREELYNKIYWFPNS